VSAIAVIDDDFQVRDGLANLLRSMGHSALVFETADAFLLAPEASVDCVITDQQMPGLSGLDLCAVLKERRPDLPVILITALALEPLAERARRLGVWALLEKPVQSEALVELLGAALPAA
jgi:FixJ family two-component response regulator